MTILATMKIAIGTLGITLALVAAAFIVSVIIIDSRTSQIGTVRVSSDCDDGRQCTANLKRTLQGDVSYCENPRSPIGTSCTSTCHRSELRGTLGCDQQGVCQSDNVYDCLGQCNATEAFLGFYDYNSSTQCLSTVFKIHDFFSPTGTEMASHPEYRALSNPFRYCVFGRCVWTIPMIYYFTVPISVGNIYTEGLGHPIGPGCANILDNSVVDPGCLSIWNYTMPPDVWTSYIQDAWSSIAYIPSDANFTITECYYTYACSAVNRSIYTDPVFFSDVEAPAILGTTGEEDPASTTATQQQQQQQQPVPTATSGGNGFLKRNVLALQQDAMSTIMSKSGARLKTALSKYRESFRDFVIYHDERARIRREAATAEASSEQ